jgi:hypothetical protein
MIHLITYTGDVKPMNIGDVMQTVALARLLDCPTVGMRRDHDDPPPEPGDIVIVNGFWYKPKPFATWPAGVRTLFAGIHIDAAEPVEPFIPWMIESPWPIGARDPATADRLYKYLGDRVRIVGCATITLPRWYGPRMDRVVNVECSEAPGEPWLQMVEGFSWDGFWNATVMRIGGLARSRAVFTSKMHTTLPCVALGTPVTFSPRNPYDPSRLSLLNWLGLKENTVLSGIDTMGAQNVFLTHLDDAIGGEVLVRPMVEPLRPWTADERNGWLRMRDPI